MMIKQLNNISNFSNLQQNTWYVTDVKSSPTKGLFVQIFPNNVVITSNSWHYSCPRSVYSILARCEAFWNIPIHNEDIHTYSIH